ncbi:hypothetical protein M3Y98_00842900 [Aphelenchoides besseyi]|nr:hypothetical protein M3Y98_00842900 [Aphelenchoides besseyi]KAI6202484.1 hypothetical protein M3Y96_00953900 [Aphelenchoides besseyi]
MEQQIEINFDRCLCIHSLLQMLDVSLQTIFYDRGIIPEPYSLMQQNESNAARKFCSSYRKLTETLRSTFRSHNRKIIEEVVVALGNTSYMPNEIYRIDVKPCSAHNEGSSPSNSSSCLDICGELTKRDHLRVFKSIAIPSNSLTTVDSVGLSPLLGKRVKVFVMLRTSGKLVESIDGLQLDESYELPSAEKVKRLRIRTTRISHGKCPDDSTTIDGDVKANDENTIWHRLTNTISMV